MSASEKIARLRETHKRWMNFDHSMLDEEAEIARSLPALLECAEAVRGVEQLLGEYIDKNGTVDVKIALAFETARAALQALAEGGGE